MAGKKTLEQLVMEAIEICTHTRCRRCDYYWKDSAWDRGRRCQGRLIADHLRKNGITEGERRSDD